MSAADADSEFRNGEPLTLEQAIANLQGDDLGLRFYSAWWLGRFRLQDAQAVVLLIAALQDTDDRTPEGGYPLRRNAARALGKIGDISAVPGLIESLQSSDFYVREAAAQSLEMLGDRRAIAPLRQRLALGVEGNNLKSTPEPDFAEPYDALLEALGTLAATDALTQVQLFLAHPIPRVQYSAARAMYQLTGEACYGDRLVQALDGDDLQLRRTALSDIGAIGYLPGGQAIAATLAENSLKLISLKGLLETEVRRGPDGAGAIVPKASGFDLSPGAIQVMDLMDSLL